MTQETLHNYQEST